MSKQNREIPEFPDDPVSKAIVDNILGKLPTKKVKENFHCETCKIDFTSKITFDIHVAGAKHLKKMKAINILNTLKEEGQVDNVGDVDALKCNVCAIKLNSSLQLQMHIAGGKHKSKCRRAGVNDLGQPMMQTDENSEDEGQPPAKIKKLSCEPCNVTLNSEQQYQQHIASQKHIDKVEGRKPAGKKFNKKKKGKGGPNNNNNNNAGSNAWNGLPLLSESFLPQDSILEELP